MVLSKKLTFDKTYLDKKVLCLGLIQSLFEGAMYTFVLEWTPALTSGTKIYKFSTSIKKTSRLSCLFYRCVGTERSDTIWARLFEFYGNLFFFNGENKNCEICEHILNLSVDRSNDWINCF